MRTGRWLLERGDLPETHRTQARRNLEFPIRKKAEQAPVAPPAEVSTWAHGGVGTRSR